MGARRVASDAVPQVQQQGAGGWPDHQRGPQARGDLLHLPRVRAAVRADDREEGGMMRTVARIDVEGGPMRQVSAGYDRTTRRVAEWLHAHGWNWGVAYLRAHEL